MKLARLDLRIAEDLKERINRHRDETGVPITIFVERLLEAALPQQPAAPKRRNARKAG